MIKYLALGMAGTLLVGCGGATTDEATPEKPEKTQLATAYEFCKSVWEEAMEDIGEDDIELLGGANPDAISVADNGHTIIVAGAQTVEYPMVTCILDKLEVPDSTRSKMQSTNSLMGRQTEEVDGITYEWSYHPDNGMDMTITDE